MKEVLKMTFQEPKFEVVKLDMEDVIVTSNCPDTISQSRPSVQTCSEGAIQDQECGDPKLNW